MGGGARSSMSFNWINFRYYFWFLTSYLRLARVGYVLLVLITRLWNIRVRYLKLISFIFILLLVVDWNIIYLSFILVRIAQGFLTHQFWTISLKIIEIRIKLLRNFTEANWSNRRIKNNFFFKLWPIRIIRCEPRSFPL
jgi:hypothetical protein